MTTVCLQNGRNYFSFMSQLNVKGEVLFILFPLDYFSSAKHKAQCPSISSLLIRLQLGAVLVTIVSVSFSLGWVGLCIELVPYSISSSFDLTDWSCSLASGCFSCSSAWHVPSAAPAGDVLSHSKRCTYAFVSLCMTV